MTIQGVINADDPEIASAIKNFSWHQLQESTQSILSGLRAYYARQRMSEE